MVILAFKHNQSPAARLPGFDVAVIGGGVVGCAVARRFALQRARVVLLEKSSDILSGASKANSALLHTGFDAPRGSLELRLMQAGYREYLEIRERLNLPLLETGALVIAWSDTELGRLESIAAQAIDNGVGDVELLDRNDVLHREPALAAHLRGALWVPGEHVIDPWSGPLAYVTQARAHGAECWFGAEVMRGAFDGETWCLETTRGMLRADHVINCAGLYGDSVETRCLGDASFRVQPRKGQFVVFDKPGASLISSIMLPVPTERTKGVVVTRTIYGNVLVGPTAEDQMERDAAPVDEQTLKDLVAQAVRIVPALAHVGINASYAGLRPATDKKEYRIRIERERHWLSLGGIRSTGLTAALGLASHAAELLSAARWARPPTDAPIWTPVPNLAEHLPRDWEMPGYGEIVCHCELVTRREIEAALASPVPPGDFGGLRRRTRAAMGRCQAFYCGAQLAELTQGRFPVPLATPLNDD
jgi:glycerol-3-phosphate dehydrogenase